MLLDDTIRALLVPPEIQKPRARYMPGTNGQFWSVEHLITHRTYITTRPHDGAVMLIEAHLTPHKRYA
jgi:hypothetical protein